MEEVKGQLSGCGYQLGRELVDNLLSMMCSPRGLVLLESQPLLVPVCERYMWERMRQGMQVSREGGREREGEGGRGRER